MDEQPQITDLNDLINLLLQSGLGDGLPRIAEILLNAAMLVERTKHLGAGPYERVEGRNGHANGFKPRTFHTSMGGLELAAPQVRGSDTPFRTSLLEKGSRSDRALKAAIAIMYLQGVSTRRVTTVMGELCGFEVSSTQVSNLTAEPDAEFTKWRDRPLPEIAHLFIDATYYKVRVDGIVRDCATLIAIGIRRDNGKRLILGVFSFPEASRKRLRTSNICETLNSQIKRRTRVVGLFPNESSLLSLVTGVLMEISEEWENGKVHLQPETKTPSL